MALRRVSVRWTWAVPAGTAPGGSDLVRRLRAWADSALAPPHASGADSELQEKLRLLGYVEDVPP